MSVTTICSTTAAAVIGALAISSCSQVWDVTAQRQAKEAVISITVSSRVRNDPNPPRREVAYKTVAAVLSECIDSGNTDSATLKSGIYSALDKVFSAKLADKITGEIMDMIIDLAGSAKDPDKLLAAEKLVLDSVKAGLDMSETVVVQ